VGKVKDSWVFEDLVGLEKISTTVVIYLVKGLSHPLMSRQMMKKLGLLQWYFPYHLKPNKAKKEAQSSGILQMLTVEEHPQGTEPKKVWFGLPQGQSNKKMSLIVKGIHPPKDANVQEDEMGRRARSHLGV
jgi:hypothetical protein